ncbi:hypothetical protein Acr_29g0006360 [Actinidia rufa]|uniref:Uncharacterized protein n=1 Tax=Actinidia rufa TaxID=165716 RepID=A0A7J0HFR9_9ERIC|nr:hypothetical protein Acr_29g0006360 [Actinidia rufa]
MTFKQFMEDFHWGGAQVRLERGMPKKLVGELKRKFTTFSHLWMELTSPITFTNDDLIGMNLSYDDALIILAAIANFNIQRILIDNGSSTGILFISTFAKMKIG